MLFAILKQQANRICIILVLMQMATFAHAEISLSTGDHAPLVSNGGEYALTQDLGVTSGNNLFHSFQTFNLGHGETATFTGSTTIENVISRITGGSISSINGTIKNTISGAETYLINPAGMVFGDGARLDVQGGFHAVTAESLQFNDGSEWYADPAKNSHFSAASPAAFGLLSGDIVMQNNATLEVTQGQALALQAKNITLDAGARLHSFSHGSAAGAEIRLNAAQNLLINGHKEQATDTDSLISRANSSGEAGDIVLQGNNITINNASISANTAASGRGADIDITAKTAAFDATTVYLNSSDFATDAGRSGDMRVQADTISMTGDSIFNAGVMGSSDGGNVTLQASGDIVLDNYSHIYADTYLGTGNGGTVWLQAHHISLNNGAFVDTTTKNIGNAGNIKIEATGTLFVGGDDIGDDTPSFGRPSLITSGTFPLVDAATELGEIGKGGQIDIQAQDLIMRDGGLIFSTSLSILEDSVSGDAGPVNIQVENAIDIDGVNPYGELDKGFATGIYLNSSGAGAGKGGQLNLSANSVTLKNGAMIISSTDSASPGGSISMDVRDTLHIAGDASNLALRAPAAGQIRYRARYSGTTYNRATSGIYSNTTASSFLPTEAGQASGGTIDVHAGSIELQDKAMISTATSGVGNAGRLSIQADTIHVSGGASISSNSTLQNSFSFADSTQRDARFLLTGDVLEVADVGNGQHGYYVQTAADLQRVAYVHSVASLEALDSLVQQETLRSGDIVEVNGQAYIYTDSRDLSLTWIPFERTVSVTLPDMTALQRANGWFNISGGETPTYPSGTYLQVLDAGNGKPANFVYVQQPDIATNGYVFGTSLQVKHFQINDRAELSQLQNNLSLINGSTAVLQNNDGTTQRFFYQGEQWLELHTPRPVDTFTNAVSNYAAARAGYVSVLPSGEFVSVGKQWVAVQNHYRVANLAERDALTPQNGDLISVADAGNGIHGLYFYADGAWQPRIEGGDAGRIDLKTHGKLTLATDSRITTEASSAGGGGIDIDSDGILQTSHSQITTSVQEGSGNGGNLNLSAQFLVQEQAPIIARAVEGNGGNIQIQTKGIFQFGGESLNPIDASSQFGVSGAVKLDAPEESVSSSVFVINGQFVKQQVQPFECAPIRDLKELSRYRESSYPAAQTRAVEWYQ